MRELNFMDFIIRPAVTVEPLASATVVWQRILIMSDAQNEKYLPMKQNIQFPTELNH